MPENTELLELLDAVKSHYTQQGYTVTIHQFDYKWNVELTDQQGKLLVISASDLYYLHYGKDKVIKRINKALKAIR